MRAAPFVKRLPVIDEALDEGIDECSSIEGRATERYAAANYLCPALFGRKAERVQRMPVAREPHRQAL